MTRMVSLALVASMAAAVGDARPSAQSPDVPAFHKAYDHLLDIYVRDGYVYYRALKSDRVALDRYVASLDVSKASYEAWSREEQLAFWLNGYNALVLQTVINHYPINGRQAGYPASSIRQIPGAFDRARHRLAGRTLTLDDIEKTVLPEFKDPRAYLALGRGAAGSGRLRSEAYTGNRLEAQLAAVRAEFVSNQALLRIERLTDEISVTPVISWREPEFVAAYDPGASGPFAQRSPIERAVLAFIQPHLLRLERDFVERNTFRMAFHQMDWRLNDLTGGRR